MEGHSCHSYRFSPAVFVVPQRPRAEPERLTSLGVVGGGGGLSQDSRYHVLYWYPRFVALKKFALFRFCQSHFQKMSNMAIHGTVCNTL